MSLYDTSPCYINHDAFVVDESYSMRTHAPTLVKVMDNTVGHLAERSKFHDQETRATLYTFSERGGERCLYYDTDVLRLPSISGRYSPRSQTALIDCTLKAIRELKQTATLYGEHAFCVYVFSDGIENNSRARAPELRAEIAGLPGNWTVIAFAPDAMAVAQLKQCGFPADNIMVWDVNSSAGFEEVGRIVRDASETFMEGRKAGIHGWNNRAGGLLRTRSFSAAEAKAALTQVTPGSFYFLDVNLADRDPGSDGAQIDRFFERKTGRVYPKGRCYYQLGDKSVKVQDYKDVAVEVQGVLYSGTLEQVRDFVGLPSTTTSVKAGQLDPNVYIFIQSTSMNRKLFPGTRLLAYW